uniref:Uncharacterized protein n=1 Tax=Setaria viridis TaxID=4556 RepID=A0A4U6VXI6_SETVI|nr:hypothetical protein SEVIR_2G247700v2 [Setaria viridis]
MLRSSPLLSRSIIFFCVLRLRLWSCKEATHTPGLFFPLLLSLLVGSTGKRVALGIGLFLAALPLNRVWTVEHVLKAGFCARRAPSCLVPRIIRHPAPWLLGKSGLPENSPWNGFSDETR